jgi:hypothetical protein
MEVTNLPGISAGSSLSLIISNGSLTSHQVDRELVYAFEKGKQLLPLLKDVTFDEFEHARPEWKQLIIRTRLQK